MAERLDDIVYRDRDIALGFSSEDPETVSMEGVEVPAEPSVSEYVTGVGQTWGEMLRGALAGTLGAGGDVESIIYGIKSVIEKEAGEGAWDAFSEGFQSETVLPTTSDVSEALPEIPSDMAPEDKKAAAQIGQMLGPGGVVKAGITAAKKGPKAVSGTTGVAAATVAPTAEGAPKNTGQFSDKFVSYLMENENADFASGKTKVARHASPEGGLDTVGFGHKLTAKEQKEGKIYGISIDDIDVDKAKTILLKDIKKAKTRAKSQLKTMHPDVDFNSLSQDKQEMLTDFAFNLKGGLKTFPSFVRGVVTDDAQLMKKEYKRFYTDAKGKTSEVKKRNTDFFNTYLKNL